MDTLRRLMWILLVAGILEGQPPARSLQVTGAVRQPLTLAPEDLQRMPRASVRTESKGAEVVYSGVPLHEILKKAGVPEGDALRGKALAAGVLAEGSDGYQVVFSLAELDPAFRDSDVLVADTADGKPLSAGQGAFRLVTPKDKRGSRSVRMLTKIEVVQIGK